MAHNEFYLVGVSAFDAAMALAGVASDVAPDGQVNLSVTSNVPRINLSTTDTGRNVANAPAFKAFVDKVRERPHIDCVSASLAFQNNAPTGFALNYTTNAQRQFIIQLTHVGEQFNVIALVDSLGQRFKLLSEEARLAVTLPEAERRALEFKEQTVGELGAQVSRLGSFLLDAQRQQTEHVQRLTAQLQAKFDEREKAMEEKAAAERQDLEAQRQEHARKVADFETRAYTFVRRNIDTKLESLLNKWDANVDVVKSTGQKRRTIHWICLTTLVLSATLCAFMAHTIVGMQAINWFQFAPFTAGAVTFVSTLIFYLRWNNAWFARLAEAEFQNRKAKVDVARASWLAELLFEWKEKKEVGLPDDVLRSLTANLFEHPTWDQDGYHPLDQFISVLRKSRRVKVGNLELENRGAPKAKNGRE